jgi:hypothetical protein
LPHLPERRSRTERTGGGRTGKAPGHCACGTVERTRSGEYRVNGQVSNMPACAAAFSFKAGDPMARKLRVDVR